MWQFFVIMIVGIITYALMLFIVRDKFFLSNLRNVFSSVKRKLHFGKVHDPEIQTESELNTIENVDSKDSTQIQQNKKSEESDVQKHE